MGSLRRKTFTRPLPDGAELFTRKGEGFAKWKDGKGKTKTAPVTTAADGSPRIVKTSRKWLAKYRNGDGLVVEVPTGCTDKTAAEQRLRELERQADRVRAGVVTSAEDKAVVRQRTPIAEHIDAYLSHLDAAGTTAEHRVNVRRCVDRIVKDCGFSRLSDIERDAVEGWLLTQTKANMGARTRNTYRSAIHAFCNWCADPASPRLLSNPLATLPKADESSDRRHERRSLTTDELRRLLFVARWRPLAEYGRETVRKDEAEAKGRRTWTKAVLTLDTMSEAVSRARDRLRDNPDFASQQDALGRERALIYKTLFLTGLRKGELTSLTPGQLDLDGDPAFLTLDAADEKNREGNSIPLRSDLAADLREWLNDKAKARQEAARNAPTVAFDSEAAKPSGCVTGDSERLPADAPLFRVPRDLFRILYRDLAAAGIPKTDEQGRVVDVHALRHSFGTHLGKAGVAPRTAQSAMRHSDPKLTANVYQDPRILDLSGAVESLPHLPLERGDSKSEVTSAKATGTDGRKASPLLPPMLPLNPCPSGRRV